MRDDLSKGGNLVSVKEAARLKKRIGQEPGNKIRGIGFSPHDRKETDAIEFDGREHSRNLAAIDRLRDKRLIKGPANKRKPVQINFEREVEIYLHRHANAEMMNRRRPRPPYLVQSRYQGKELKEWKKNILKTEQYRNALNAVKHGSR